MQNEQTACWADLVPLEFWSGTFLLWGIRANCWERRRRRFDRESWEKLRGMGQKRGGGGADLYTSALIEWLEAQVAELERHRWSCSWTLSLCERIQYSFSINRDTDLWRVGGNLKNLDLSVFIHRHWPTAARLASCSSLRYSSHDESSVCIEWVCWPFDFCTKSTTEITGFQYQAPLSHSGRLHINLCEKIIKRLFVSSQSFSS